MVAMPVAALTAIAVFSATPGSWRLSRRKRRSFGASLLRMRPDALDGINVEEVKDYRSTLVTIPALWSGALVHPRRLGLLTVAQVIPVTECKLIQ